jgi:hypothetical protein
MASFRQVEAGVFRSQKKGSGVMDAVCRAVLCCDDLDL